MQTNGPLMHMDTKQKGEIDKEFIAKSNQTPEKKAKNRRIKIIFATS